MTETWLLLKCLPEYNLDRHFVLLHGAPLNIFQKLFRPSLVLPSCPCAPLSRISSLPDEALTYTPSLTLGVCAVTVAPLFSSSDTRQVFLPGQGEQSV